MEAHALQCAVLLAVILIGVTDAQGGFLERPCSPREVYLQCGTACPRICGRPARTFCTYQCVSGCFCARGFIRTSNGNCIPENQCYYRG
nr:chymotrypsin-elastase inhibitor ixodidin-like [Dermacentor andersoni]